MFQSNELRVVNMTLNSARFIFTAILTMYAIYKPYDYESEDVFEN